MYQNYFGLAEAPFSIAPAPRYLYMSQRHQEALAHLLYGVNGGGGFVLLTGEVGAGKTTVCRCLLEQIPESCDVAYIFNPKLTVEELLSTICIEFGIAVPAGNSSIKVFVDYINAHLLDAHARGRHAVLIIDEAQNLSADVLEQMRLLTNLETNERKLLQIILIGQPELAAMLERPELKQLSQRIVARYHLGPLSQAEVGAYIRHRLDVAGTQRPLFPPRLMRRVYRLSGGVPRIINVLCDRALLGTYVQGKDRVDSKTLAQAEREILQTPATHRRKRTWQLALALFVLVALGLPLAAWQWPSLINHLPTPTDTIASTKAPASPEPSPITPAWLTQSPESSSIQAAYSALFKAWGVDDSVDDSNGDLCQHAEAKGLRCRSEFGSLLELRQFNRPAVLTLRNANGDEFHATLIKLDTDQATLKVGETTSSVNLGLLASHWPGHYHLLWRAPEALRETLRPGARGAAVTWVSQQLDRLEGKSPPLSETRLFDAALGERIKQFQRTRGLTPDGNVGPKTLIHLVGDSDPSAPTLLTHLTIHRPGVR
jgi:general secretion pathway protein A